MQISSKEGVHDYFFLKNKLGSGSGSGMFSDPDPAPLKQIISDPNGSGPAPQHWLIGIGSDLETLRNGSRAGGKKFKYIKKLDPDPQH